MPLARLRTSLVLLVVAHHAVLAYHAYAPRPAEPLNPVTRAWSAFPVVDDAIWAGIEVFVMFNDGFFMALLFLISGVFVWPSLVRKGSFRFARGRVLRLGIPFVVSAALLGPLAYYPTYLRRRAPAGRLAGRAHGCPRTSGMRRRTVRSEAPP